MWKNPRVTHCRFNKSVSIYDSPKQNNKFDRVVSIAWNYDTSANIIIYGATVFKRVSVDEQWTKKLHSKTALDRYTKNPVRVMMFGVKLSDLSTDYIDWYIAEKLIYDHGCESHDGGLIHLHPHKTLENYNSDSDEDTDEDGTDSDEGVDYDPDERNDVSILLFVLIILLSGICVHNLKTYF